MIRYALVWLIVLAVAACEIQTPTPAPPNSTVPGPTDTATLEPWPTATPTDTPEPGTVPPATETASPTPWPTATATATPTEIPINERVCSGRPATIFRRLRAGTTVVGTTGDDVIVVVIQRRNATVQVWGDAGDDRICVRGDSTRVFINGGEGSDRCEYAGTSRQGSIFVCEFTILRGR